MVKDKLNQNCLKVKDYSVSGEIFHLMEISECGFLETVPQPPTAQLPKYYKSEDYISHTNTKRNWFEKTYHIVRGVALKKKLGLINAFIKENKTLLDVGCGTGDFLRAAQKNNWKVFGVEPNEMARQMANKKTKNSVYDTDHLSKFNASSFDVITLWHVLEHLPSLDNQITLFKNLLKPNGTLIVAVPNHKSFDATYYKNFWAAYDVPRHLWHFNKSSMHRLFSKHAMEVVTIKPMWFDAFYVSLLSEKYKTGKINFVNGFWVGLRSNLKAIITKETSSLIYIIKNK